MFVFAEYELKRWYPYNMNKNMKIARNVYPYSPYIPYFPKSVFGLFILVPEDRLCIYESWLESQL